MFPPSALPKGGFHSYLLCDPYPYMRRALVFIIFILLSIRDFAQSNIAFNTISVIYGISSAKTATTGIYSNYSFVIRGGERYGASYSMNFNKWLSVDLSALYIQDKAQITALNSGSLYAVDAKTNMLSVQGSARFNFLKYLFIDGGIGVDEQVNSYTRTGDQTGVAAEAGFGAKVNFGQIHLFLNPFVHAKGVIDIYWGSHKSSNDELIEHGMKFGVGYNF